MIIFNFYYVVLKFETVSLGVKEWAWHMHGGSTFSVCDCIVSQATS